MVCRDEIALMGLFGILVPSGVKCNSLSDSESIYDNDNIIFLVWIGFSEETSLAETPDDTAWRRKQLEF